MSTASSPQASTWHGVPWIAALLRAARALVMRIGGVDPNMVSGSRPDWETTAIGGGCSDSPSGIGAQRCQQSLVGGTGQRARRGPGSLRLRRR